MIPKGAVLQLPERGNHGGGPKGHSKEPSSFVQLMQFSKRQANGKGLASLPHQFKHVRDDGDAGDPTGGNGGADAGANGGGGDGLGIWEAGSGY